MKSNHLENYKISLKNQSIESLFLELGVDWRNMEINKPIDVSGQNYVVSSFDENELKNVYSKILKIVRKDDQKTCKIKTKNNGEFSVAFDHLFYSKIDDDGPFWIEAIALLGQENVMIISNDNTWEKVEVFEGQISPILDIEIENTHCYYSNNLLSHNTMYGSPITTPGGQAIPFHASVRIELSGGSKIEKDDDIIGINVNAKIIKNKVASPHRRAEFCIIYGKGIVEHEQLFDIMREAGTQVLDDGTKVTVEGTSAWKNLKIVDKNGKFLTKNADGEKFYKADFGRLWKDTTLSPFLESALEKIMVRNTNAPEDFSVQEDIVTEEADS